MQQEFTDNGRRASDEYRCSLSQRDIAALLVAPLLAALVYWLTLPQGAAIAVITLLFHYGVAG